MRITLRALSFAALTPLVAVVACGSSSATPKADAGTNTPQPDAMVPVEAAAPPSEAGADAALPPPAAGGTGAFGIITIGGKQKMYLPQQAADAAGRMVIAVVDVGAAGNGAAGAPALIKTVDLGFSDSGVPEFATATGGDSSMVVAVSTDYPTVWFIDPVKDVLVNKITLDPTLFGQSSFSGGGGYVTGVAIDSAHHRAILSVWNGFAIVDLATQQIKNVIAAPPSENFGFDSTHQRIIAPFYQCATSALNGAPPSACGTPKAPDGTVMTDGLSVIDLIDNSVYTYEMPPVVDDGGVSVVGPTATAPVGSEPDSAAADPTTGVILIPAESDGFQSVIDLSQATFDKAKLTVSAPQKIIPGLGLTGVAIESTSHLAFWEEEHSPDVAVANLTAANAGNTAWVHGFLPDLPGDAGGGFRNLGDPHGIAVTTGLSTSGPVGFVVDSGLQWVARIDLAKMAAAEAADATTELTPAQMAPFVTYLDANTKEQ